jgi:hemerythrin-like domain-containing protein
MKRHPQLQTLSREHHGALKLARDVRKACESADAGEITALAQRVVRVFPVELDPHFCVEEQGILITLAHAGENELARRTRHEHEELRRLAGALATPDAGTLLRFAELLAAHVRFEEREVFAAAQASLAAESGQSIP